MCVILMIPLCSLYIQNEHNGQNFIVPLTSLPSLFYLTIVLKRISVFWKPLKFLNYFTKCNIYILSYTCDQSNLGHSLLLRYLLIELHDPISKLKRYKRLHRGFHLSFMKSKEINSLVLLLLIFITLKWLPESIC